ncbi:hypothetical protein AQUCO_03900087v1 [Aquilegia coerulea]|uniref:non-specific serine/threonine protein kinase n=1 Tax=Aquilegia coerulea TaxID=218851 RepID=A0A2G5CSX7_AQUCA|nr:hypothetical protein AQUCO_03900087v1 [Aquilegia coerulea]
MVYTEKGSCLHVCVFPPSHCIHIPSRDYRLKERCSFRKKANRKLQQRYPTIIRINPPVPGLPHEALSDFEPPLCEELCQTIVPPLDIFLIIKNSSWYYTYVLGSTTLVTASSRNESDRSALLAIKSKIRDDPLGALNSWNHSLHHCDWQGIICSRRHRERVTVLDLGHKELEGTLSPYIGNLSFLKAIDLSENNFHGEIPQEIGRLFRLRDLDLNNNSFQGEVPRNITYCSDLREIDLIDNKLSGSIFAGFSSLSKLIMLGLGKNNFNGKIPPSLGNLTSLADLFLGYNRLEGNIPDDLCNMRSLGYFYGSINNLTGKIPSCLFNHSSIYSFAVAGNQLQGTLPPNIGLTLPNLQDISLATNKFSGPIPVSLSNLTKLEKFEISENAFTGSVPRDLGKLQNLEWLLFGKNQIGTKQGGGGDDLNFINSLTNCTKLERLDFNMNVLNGPLPDSISNLSSTTIRYLNMEDNSIYGSIPVGIGNLINIDLMSFSYNKLNGAIPTSIGNLNQLKQLYLGFNLLSGQIPSSMGNLTQLDRVSLVHNNLNGRIPPTLGNCKNLAYLSLSQNNLVGAIPIQVISISSLTIGLILSQNSLTGSLPLEVGNLTNIVTLYISDNKLSGHIPESLGKCLNLVELSMEGNFFQGEIPKSFTSLRGLNYLDLSSNNLSGKIPEYFELFSELGYLNLSFNQLEGRIPQNGVFANASLVSVVGNHNLCGGIEGLKLQPCIQKKTKKKTSLSFKVIIPIIVGSLCLLLLLLFFLTFYRRKVFNNKPSSTRLSNIPSYKRISYLELFRATNGFSVDYLIGVGSYGSVFKGVLQDINQTVAVKVLNLQREGASKSFLTECNALRHLRHRNLLKIITACSSVDFQGNDFRALVFEFMPYGSLEEWLHPIVNEQQHDSRNLSFIQRLNIAIDVASALDYLHNRCQPGVVHCDLKPSNVLLDDDMTARVADFGIAKMFAAASYDSSQTQPSSDLIRGSIGYVAPEYGMGVKVSMQGDVYSYGILLLEMFTRKRPTDDMFLNGLSLHSYAEMALPNQVMGVIDPMVLLDDNTGVANPVEHSNSQANLQESLVSVITLGVLCSADAPTERKTMSEVVSELHHIKKHYRDLSRSDSE